jgi:drug/metabolite transporter (DMT)-like permease
MSSSVPLAQPGIRHSGPVEFALLLLLSVMWGSSFIAIKIAVDHGMPPVALATIRIAIGAVLLTGLAVLRRQALPRGRKVWAILLLLGIIGNALPFFLISWGEQYTPSNLAAILMAVIPIFVVLLAHLMTHDEKLTLGKSVGVTLAFIGIVVLVGVDALGGLGRSIAGQLAILAGCVSYSFQGVTARRLPPMGSEMITGMILILAFLCLLPFWLIHDRPWQMSVSTPALLATIWLGVISTAAGNLLYYLILRRAGAGFASFNNYLVPLMGIAWGFLCLGEKPGWNALVALALILGGLACARFLKGRGAVATVKN